eukprot:CAMPEP_0203936002 /NCGR_PEP_ID=MMETSP0359-20131031/73653_1 /ASSEMBLY_ACC=CAM_ASM_000338 /TAXON_ID=268821 /ORGANISM="Scrippsiella Hangoei, Strain SHTV-5" /LENGTH=48 /DNA_ID= /DNA_START= /DNA_END= /DNA_ORIENTATION=
MSTKSLNAKSQCPTFSHALTAALHEIVLNSTWADAMSAKRLNALPHKP